MRYAFTFISNLLHLKMRAIFFCIKNKTKLKSFLLQDPKMSLANRPDSGMGSQSHLEHPRPNTPSVNSLHSSSRYVNRVYDDLEWDEGR